MGSCDECKACEHAGECMTVGAGRAQNTHDAALLEKTKAIIQCLGEVVDVEQALKALALSSGILISVKEQDPVRVANAVARQASAIAAGVMFGRATKAHEYVVRVPPREKMS